MRGACELVASDGQIGGEIVSVIVVSTRSLSRVLLVLVLVVLVLVVLVVWLLMLLRDGRVWRGGDVGES